MESQDEFSYTSESEENSQSIPEKEKDELELESEDELRRKLCSSPLAERQKAGMKILEICNGPEPTVSRRLRFAVEKAKDKVLYDLAVEDARARLDEGDYDWFSDRARPVDYTLKGMHEAQCERLKLKATARNQRGTFISCSPPECTDAEFVEGLKAFVSYLRSAGASGVFTIEQRSEEPEKIFGRHVHILLPDVVIPRAQMLPSAAEAFWGKRTAKPLPMQFNVKFTHTDTDNVNCLNYMDPDKPKKESKQSKLIADAKLREMLQILPLTEF